MPAALKFVFVGMWYHSMLCIYRSHKYDSLAYQLHGSFEFDDNKNVYFPHLVNEFVDKFLNTKQTRSIHRFKIEIHFKSLAIELIVLIGAKSKSTPFQSPPVCCVILATLFHWSWFGFNIVFKYNKCHMNGPQVTLTNGRTNNFPYTKLLFVHSLYSFGWFTLHLRPGCQTTVHNKSIKEPLKSNGYVIQLMKGIIIG